MLTKFARLAGLGAYAACGGFLALLAGLVYVTLPTSTNGIDMTSALVAWISLSGVIGALIVVHLAIARQLMRLAKGAEKRHPL